MRLPMRVVWVLLAVALSVGLLLGLLSIAGQAGSAITWRTVLDRYLAQEATSGGGAWRIAQTVRAGRPDLFTGSLGGQPVGDSLYPGVYGPQMSRATEPAYPPVNPLATDDNKWRQGYRFEEPAYPPVEVWCVLLDRVAPVGQPQQSAVMFVARYESLYTTNWVLYSGARLPLPPDFVTGLQRLECELKAASQP